MRDDAEASGIDLSVTLLSQMVRYVSSLGIDVEKLLRSNGLDPMILKTPDARIPVETYVAIQEEAARVSKDEYFGLRMGEFAEPGSYSIVGYMMMNCKNLGEAFQKGARYSRIVGTLIQARAYIGFRKVRIVYSTPSYAPTLSRICFESTFSSMVRMMRSVTGQRIDPLEVTFTYSRPASMKEYDRIFHSPVLFERKHNSMTLDTKIGAIPMLAANPRLLEYFENYARDFLAGIDKNDKNTRLVTELILSHLDDESLSIRAIAREMGLSVRALQARLKDEGKMFSEVLSDTRERLAKKYLREDYSVDDITYLLGFSEPSVFRKAFKKWAGITPKEYREMESVGG